MALRARARDLRAAIGWHQMGEQMEFLETVFGAPEWNEVDLSRDPCAGLIVLS
jgi:hypothetical protein